MALPKNIPTLEARHGRRWTRLDNVWRNTDSESKILACEVQGNLRPVNTDHLPIITTLDLSFYPTNPDTHFNFKQADWDKFENMVKDKMENSPLLNSPAFNTEQELEDAVNKLFKILQEATAVR